MDSSSDLRLLKVILKEQGISLSQFQEQEEKKEEELTKKDIINLIDDAELTPSQLKRIQRVISQVAFMEAIDDYLEKVGDESNILPKEMVEFKMHLRNLNIEEDFAKYIKNPKDFDLSKNNFMDSVGDAISNDDLIKLFRVMGSTTDEKNVNIGPGEILFSILFKNTRKRETGGDLTVGKQANVELKASTGSSGAVIAKGYNRGTWAETKRKGKFEQFVAGLEMDEKDEADALKYLDKKIKGGWSSKLAFIYDLYSDQDNFDKKKFESGVVSILSIIYNQSKWYPKGEFFNLESYFSENDMDSEKFRIDLAKELIKEYMDAYKFDGILYIDGNGNIDYQQGDQITSEIGKSIAIAGPSDDVPRFKLKI
tara:strand:- start:146 stop:1249 length:1104 start_codon:yes stop_codon:yes gene_type:complete